jgi:hypothetical protein
MLNFSNSVDSVADAIPDFFHPGSSNKYKKGGERDFSLITFFAATISLKLKLLYLLNRNTKNLSQFDEDQADLKPKKILTSSWKWILEKYPGSASRSKKAPDP